MTTTTNHRAVVVTGASQGVGAVIADRLASGGHLVFACSRTAHQDTAPQRGIVPVHLDVTDSASIAAAGAYVAAQLPGDGLYGLVNNAGILHTGPLELSSIDSINAQLATNVIGPLALTQTFLPMLRAGRGRIVNVSSINADLALPFWGVYSASKAALDAISDALRIELEPWGIPVTVLTLGAFDTGIRRHGDRHWPSHDPDDLYTRARGATAALVELLDRTAGDPREVAAAVTETLAHDPPPARRLVGDGVEDLLALARQPAEVRNDALRQLIASAAS